MSALRRGGGRGTPAVRPLRRDELREWEAFGDLDPEERGRAVAVRCGVENDGAGGAQSC